MTIEIKLQFSKKVYYILFFNALCVATTKIKVNVGCSNRTRSCSFDRLRGISKIIYNIPFKLSKYVLLNCNEIKNYYNVVANIPIIKPSILPNAVILP